MTDESAVFQSRGQVLDFFVTDALKKIGGRMCRIYGFCGSGTGFLISQDLVMTALHVVDPFRKKNVFNKEISFAFLINSTGSEIPLVKIMPSDLVILASDSHLDYAIVRLPTKVGLKNYEDSENGVRGWFSIAPATRVNTVSFRSLLLVQFPSGRMLRPTPSAKAVNGPFFGFSAGEIVDWTPDRVYHNAASERGSSGGICLADRTLLPVALHKGNSTDDMNCAVPISAILKHIKATNAELYKEIVSSEYKSIFNRILPDSQIVLNRDDVIEKVVLMMVGFDLRPFFIAGQSRSGRTFTKNIVESFRPRCVRHVDLSFGLDDYILLVATISEQLLSPGEQHPVFDGVEPKAAFFRRSVDEILLLANSRAEARGQIEFIFIDNVDIKTMASVDLILLLQDFFIRYQYLRIGIAGVAVCEGANKIDVLYLKSPSRQDFINLAVNYDEYFGLGIASTILEEAVDALLGEMAIDSLPLNSVCDLARKFCKELPHLASGTDNYGS